MQTVVYESNAANFGPLVKARTVGQLRCGRHRLIDRIERLTGEAVPLFCRPEVAEWVTQMTGRPCNEPIDGPTLALDACCLWDALPEADGSFAGYVGERLVCVRTDDGLSPDADLSAVAASLPRRDVEARVFEWPWELVLANADQLRSDWQTESRTPVPQAFRVGSGGYGGGVHVVGENVRVGEGVTIKPGVVIDAEEGPVWIGDRVKIGPNATIQGPCFLDDHCVVQAHAHIREGVTAGPFCKLGGEIEETILQGFSNKQHHGFLGHSYLGEWINLGAGFTNSDLKNTYGKIRVPILGDPAGTPEVDSGSQFCGMVAGDYAKLGINTAAPTGAVVGFGTNVVSPTAPKWTDDLEWVTPDSREPFAVDKAVAIAERMMARRGRELGPVGAELFRRIAGKV